MEKVKRERERERERAEEMIRNELEVQKKKKKKVDRGKEWDTWVVEKYQENKKRKKKERRNVSRWCEGKNNIKNKKLQLRNAITIFS